MTLNDYQAEARTTAQYPTDGLYGLLYTILGLAGEAGEASNKTKKILRDSNGFLTHEARLALRDELGDALWYLGNAAHELGFTLDEIASANLAKLKSRQQRGAITGSGDHR